MVWYGMVWYGAMYLKCGVVGGVHRVHRHLAALPAVQAVQLRQHDEGHHLVDDYDLKVKTIIAPLFSLCNYDEYCLDDFNDDV